MHATKMLINEDLTEFEDFNMKKQMSGNDSVSRSITLRSDIRTLKLEEWLNMDRHMTTSQIKKATEPVFRLKVIATGSKSNDDITVVLFEDVVANLIGKSAATVLASLIEDGDEEALPMDFQPILFKDYLISIRVSMEYNIVKGYNDYSVEHLTADEGIVGNIAA
ncbi:hypothetical protein OROMI_016559 [Orobanche minor]